MREFFRDVKLSKSNKLRLEMINKIIREYQAAGYKLTLRQLYYQLVSRSVIPNKVSEYTKLSTLLKEGRMAGIVDWEAIEDRLRVPYTPASWDSPEDIMDTVVHQYKQPRMEGQEKYLEVWVEKDALSGVLRRVTSKYHVPILVNRGYSSASAMYDSYNRFKNAIRDGKMIELLYLGDFDPSGVDMIRDVRDRPLEMLCASPSWASDAYDVWVERVHNGDSYDADDYLREEYDDYERFPNAFEIDEDDKSYYSFDSLRAFIHEAFKVIPIALTKEQINRYTPPPNPAKVTDPRSKGFIAEHGGSSWEVDALKPEVLHAILESNIVARIDGEKYQDVLRQEEIGRAKLRKAQKLLSQINVDESDLENSDEDEENED